MLTLPYTFMRHTTLFLAFTSDGDWPDEGSPTESHTETVGDIKAVSAVVHSCYNSITSPAPC
ncbi:hypothetical protein BD414DRAFT_496018 [Trametes punicea]|nr:hypothetical protein BD414DRAFT_496018 [Trametes punicea]